MEINKVIVGFLQTNCYILNKNNKCLIIDPGDEPDKIISHIHSKVLGIIITHYHFDHIGALDELVNKYNCKFYDINNLKEGLNNIDTFNFTMYKTPGHKEDLISLLFDNNLFCGDFIFQNTIGRTDLKGGNFNEMQKSIQKIIKLNSNTTIYPGHGPSTTLKKELTNLLNYLN